MYIRTNESYYPSYVKSENRWWYIGKIGFYINQGWSDYSLGKYVKSFTISDYSTDGSNISMGVVAGSKLTLTLVSFSKTMLKNISEGSIIRLPVDLYGNDYMTTAVSLMSVPFIVDNVKTKKSNGSGYNVTVTAYDLSYKMTHPYVSSYENATGYQIVKEIADKYGLSVDISVKNKIAELGMSSTSFKPLSGFSCKETLGYIAGCFGCFARINNNMSIEFVWYDNAVDPEIGKDRFYVDGNTFSNNEYVINLIETGTKDNPIVYPENANGYSINFENPYITPELVRKIYETKIEGGKLAFKTGKIKYKGSPVNMPGSIVTATDIDGTTAIFYIMKRTLNFDGGISETIECLGESETTINYKVTSPTQQKINRLYSRIEEAIKNATDIITQTKGSVFEFIPVDETDPSKGNSGWKLYSTAFGNKNVILANSSGIGFSSNGGQSFDAAAIYIDENGQGHINGNFITAGSISADKIDTSQIVVGGSGDYKDLEELLNGVVDTSNNSVTSVDVLYAKNQSQTVAPTKPTSPENEIARGWTTTAPEWEEGYFIWTLTKTVSGNGVNYSDPVCITSASGTAGADGVGISEVKNYYLASASSSGVTHETLGWTLEIQTITSQKPFLWNYEEVVYTNGNAQKTDPVIVGTLGKGIKLITEFYATSTSPDKKPTQFSSVNIPTLNPVDKYLWNSEYVEYTDGTFEYRTPVIIGVYGDTGAQGEAGATGEKGQSVKDVEEQYYLSTSSSTQTGGSWSTTQPAWSSGRYIWTRSVVTWERADGSTYTTTTIPILAKAINGANSTASSAQSAANTAQNTANTANTNATNALSVANTANGKVASWCHANNTTLIDGSKIYTGSITAMQIAAGSITADKLAVGSITTDKLNVGWNGNNCASYPSDSWLEHTNKSYLTISNGGTNYLPKITVSTSTYSTYAIIKSPYFFCPSGSTVLISFKSYVKTTSNSTRYMEVTLEKKGETAGKTFINTKSDSANKEINHSTRYLVAESGYYCITFASFGNYVDSYLKDFEVYVANKGEMIVNGRISSVDKNTYFDLDTGEVALKASNGDFVANFASSKLEYTKDTTLIGGIEGVTYESINRLAIYSSSIVNIGVGNDASSAAGAGLYISKDDVGSTLPIYALNGLYTKNIWSDGLIEFSGEDRSEFIRLNRSFADTNNAFKNYSAQLNLGITGFTDRQGNKQVASFHLNSSYNSNENTYMYFSHDFYEAKGCLYFAKGNSSNRSADLALGATDIWFNGNSLINSSSEKYKTNIAVYDDKALNIVNDSKIYTYKYISDLKRPNGAKTKYGLIIERECPAEIVDNSGDAISLYSMCSILWKAVQELSDEVNELKAVK